MSKNKNTDIPVFYGMATDIAPKKVGVLVKRQTNPYLNGTYLVDKHLIPKMRKKKKKVAKNKK